MHCNIMMIESLTNKCSSKAWCILFDTLPNTLKIYSNKVNIHLEILQYKGFSNIYLFN